MRVAVLSYPMLFQTQGGLQIQVLETIEALKRLGIDAELIDPNRQHLTDYDVIHVFSAINGTRRIAEHAKAFGLPVVTSPLIRPNWTKKSGQRARVLDLLVGKLTHWEIKTEFGQISSCLNHSDHLIALGNIEKESLIDAFQIPAEKITVIPNGIPSRFFGADSTPFCQSQSMAPGFVLNVASISGHKNQLAVAEATLAESWPTLLVGECLPSEKAYLERCLALRHVKYLGKLDYSDPLLPSIYAAAGVFCLPSLSEVMPLTILESLAAGTPVVTTRHHAMDLGGMEDVLIEVSPNSKSEIQHAVSHFLAHRPTREQCQTAVRRFTWDSVAAAIAKCYENVMAQHLETTSR